MDRVFEQDRKLKEFMATKATDRQEKIIQSGGVVKTRAEPLKSLWPHTNVTEKEKEIKFTSQESLVESLEVYEKAFAEIKRVTGTDDVEGLVQQFKAVEDTNFSLFNYVNEINNEIEKLSEEISDTQDSIDGLKVQGVELAEERKKEMAVLESTLNAALAKNQQYETQTSDCFYGIAEIRKGVDKLVKVFQSTKFSFADGQAHIINGQSEDNEEALQQEADVEGAAGEEQLNESNFTNRIRFLLGSTAITDNNLLQILGVIEHKMNELMTLNYMFSSPRKAASAGSAQPNAEEGQEKQEPTMPKEKQVALIMPLLGTVGGLLGQGPTAPVAHISIVTPSTGDDHDSDDNLSEEDDRPLTREELRQKTLKGVCLSLTSSDCQERKDERAKYGRYQEDRWKEDSKIENMTFPRYSCSIANLHLKGR